MQLVAQRLRKSATGLSSPLRCLTSKSNSLRRMTQLARFEGQVLLSSSECTTLESVIRSNLLPSRYGLHLSAAQTQQLHSRSQMFQFCSLSRSFLE